MLNFYPCVSIHSRYLLDDPRKITETVDAFIFLNFELEATCKVERNRQILEKHFFFNLTILTHGPGRAEARTTILIDRNGV